MALTRDQITESGTYTVQFEYGQLSPKRFKDAVALVRGINGQRELYAWNEKTGKHEYSDANKTPAASSFDAARKTWTVTVPASRAGIDQLQTLAHIYNAVVERA